MYISTLHRWNESAERVYHCMESTRESSLRAASHVPRQPAFVPGEAASLVNSMPHLKLPTPHCRRGLAVMVVCVTGLDSTSVSVL